MNKGRSALLAATAAMLAMAGASSQFGQVVNADPATATASKAERANIAKNSPTKSAEQQSLKNLFRGTGGSPYRCRYPAPGWSVATDRRRAKKARNVARNRAAHR